MFFTAELPCSGSLKVSLPKAYTWPISVTSIVRPTPAVACMTRIPCNDLPQAAKQCQHPHTYPSALQPSSLLSLSYLTLTQLHMPLNKNKNRICPTLRHEAAIPALHNHAPTALYCLNRMSSLFLTLLQQCYAPDQQ